MIGPINIILPQNKGLFETQNQNVQNDQRPTQAAKVEKRRLKTFADPRNQTKILRTVLTTHDKRTKKLST